MKKTINDILNEVNTLITVRNTLYAQEDYDDAKILTIVITHLQGISSDILIEQMDAQIEALNKVMEKFEENEKNR